MNLDIELIKQAFSTLGTALTFLKQAKDLLPDSSQRQEVNLAIESVEKELVHTELKLAEALGHQICHNHWPSGIMISKDNKIWKCPSCGNEIDNTSKPPKFFSTGRRK